MNNNNDITVTSEGCGCCGTGTGCGTLGSIIAVIVSYSANHSIGWAIIHGLLGWIYVLYYWITQA